MILELLHTIVSRLLVIILILIGIVPLAILLLIPEKWRYNRVLFFVAHCYYWAILKAALVPITFIGAENIPQEPAIIVANHQSALDIPLVGFLMGQHPHIWLATTWLLKSWVFKLWLPRVAVLVDMSSPMTGMRSLVQAIKKIEGKKRHVIIFPEGQRYSDGGLHEFFGGFIILAKKTKRPVVPIRIFNAEKVYPRDSRLAHWYPITVVIGKPMMMEEHETDEIFKDRVYQWFLDQKICKI